MSELPLTTLNPPAPRPDGARATHDTALALPPALVNMLGRRIPAWAAHLRDAQGKSPDTRRVYVSAVRGFLAWLPEHGGDDAPSSAALIGRYVRERAAGTASVRLAALRSFFGFLVETGEIPSNPADGVRGGGAEARRRDDLTHDEVRALLAICRADRSEAGARDGALVALMVYTGIRTIEAHRADVEDVGMRAGRRVLHVHGKGRQGKGEFVVIPSEAEPWVRRWRAARTGLKVGADAGPLFVSLSPRSRGERLSRRGIRAAITGRFREAGITEATKTVHSLRHTAITTTIRNGATPTQAQAMARHKRAETTLGYFHEHDRLAAPAEDLISYRL